MKNLIIAFLLASTAAVGVYMYSDSSKSELDIEPAGKKAAVLPIAKAQGTTPQSTNASVVDESALRYFATRGDKVRLQTEISRLKALYPDWSPPEDPLAPVQVRDAKLDQLWKLFADGQYAELRKALAAAKVIDPQWTAPADLVENLGIAEARQRLINASDNKQYDMVVTLASQTPKLLTCNEVDVLWRLAEAFAKQDKTERARDGYLYVLQNCTLPADRLVTVQKALENLPYDEAQLVLAQQKTGADGIGEFAALNGDIARRFVAMAAQTPDMKIDHSYLTSLEALAQQDGSALDAEMLGWYYLRRNELQKAEKWFVNAKSKDDSLTVSQGMALILNSRGDYAQAENIMYPWREKSPEADTVYFAATANLLATDPPARMPATISQEVMSRIAAAVIAEKNVATAQQLGWYARALGQNQTAIQWFQTALSWDNSSEPSAYGLALSLLTLDDKAGLEQVKQAWGPASQRIANIGLLTDKNIRTIVPTVNGVQAPAAQRQIPIQAQEQPQRPRQKQTSEASNTANARANTSGCRSTLEGPAPTGGNAVARGWCLMEINRPLEAVKSFESALATGNANDRSDAAYGQALAYLRVGLVDKAAVSAIKAPMSKARQKELRVTILSDRAVAAYRSGQFRDTLFILEQRSQLAPPRKDLMALQAASYLKLRRYDDARIVYEALAASGDREGIRGMAAIRDLQRPN